MGTFPYFVESLIHLAGSMYQVYCFKNLGGHVANKVQKFKVSRIQSLIVSWELAEKVWVCSRVQEGYNKVHFLDRYRFVWDRDRVA